MEESADTQLPELLAKVARLELNQGCKDFAVVGGFSEFVRKKLWEAPDFLQPKRWSARFRAYPRLGEEARIKLVRSFESFLKERGRRPNPASWSQPESPPGAPPPSEPPIPEPPAKPAGKKTRPEPKKDTSKGVVSELQWLPGVGPHRARLLARLGLETREDLLRHLPLRYEDRRTLTPIRDLPEGEKANLVARVRHSRIVKGFRGRGRLEVLLEDETGTVEAVFFNQAYLEKILKPGLRAFFHGKLRNHRGRRQWTPEAFEVLPEEENPSLGLVPIYPLTEGLHQRFVQRLVQEALDELLPSLIEPMPEGLRQELQFPSLAGALQALHAPESERQAEKGRQRLAFDELLVLQLALAFKQAQATKPNPAAAIQVVPGALESLRKTLPFQLTEAQERSIAEILEDLRASRPMARLLQGDVGAGKTVVSAFAAVAASSARRQVALMAPTEILAEQHFQTLSRLLEPVGLPVGLLTGKTKSKDRRQLLEGLVEGRLPVVVGTHALIEPDVEFENLGLIVIDEQHRFGVEQRTKLRSKTGVPNLLVMTATPIPRTLSLTLFGDLDRSLLDQMPPGRTPVKTFWKRPKGLTKIWDEVQKRAQRGEQTYVVCSLIETSESLDARPVLEAFEDAQQGSLSNLRLGVLYSRLPKEEKEATMQAYRQGEIDVLFSTTVIEVGVDVPNATCMVILDADRFGLAQLHQLRGRVGRSSKKSVCYLVSEGKGPDVQRRLKVLTKSQDGFEIAEADLEIRGPGEYFGTKQSGLPALAYAQLPSDGGLLDQARRLARRWVREDPKLEARERQVYHQEVKAKYARFLKRRH